MILRPICLLAAILCVGCQSTAGPNLSEPGFHPVMDMAECAKIKAASAGNADVIVDMRPPKGCIVAIMHP